MRMKVLKLVLCTFVIPTCLCVREIHPQSPREINRVVNMIDDAVPKVIESIITADSTVRTIAIWGIEVSANQPIDVSLLEDRLTKALIHADNYSRFRVVDRAALQIQATDLGLDLPRIFDRQKMVPIGTALRIDAFLSGSANLTDEGLILNLNLVGTEIGSFVWTAQIIGQDQAANIRSEKLTEYTRRVIQQELAQKQVKSSSMGLLRSLFLPGWGQFYAKRFSRGITYLFVEAISWGILLQATSNQDGDTDTQKQIGVTLVTLNHLVSSVDALFSVKRHNQELTSRSGYDLSLQLHQRDKHVQFTYYRRF